MALPFQVCIQMALLNTLSSQMLMAKTTSSGTMLLFHKQLQLV